MITAVDTNVLLDVFLPDPVFGPTSWEALMRADEEGGLIVCEPVYAELAACFPTQAKLDQALETLAIKVTPIPRSAAYHAGQAWKRYRAAGGTRTRIMTDFLIAAHAQLIADQFMTRDRGFYRTHFRDLKISDPTPPPSAKS